MAIIRHRREFHPSLREQRWDTFICISFLKVQQHTLLYAKHNKNSDPLYIKIKMYILWQSVQLHLRVALHPAIFLLSPPFVQVSRNGQHRHAHMHVFPFQRLGSERRGMVGYEATQGRLFHHYRTIIMIQSSWRIYCSWKVPLTKYKHST